jgi:hypothetical protein
MIVQARTVFTPFVIPETVLTVTARGFVVPVSCQLSALIVCQYLGPDSKETITFTTPEYCVSCQYWFKGGAQHRR